MEELNLLQRVVVWALPVLFAITVHETAHGWMALRLGDPTAMMLGRLSINPAKHIDPLGTVLVPGLLLLVGGFLFGWAKPVPITYENLRHPKRDMALVAVAGPLSNFAMALFWALMIRLGLEMGAGTGNGAGLYLVYSGVAGIFINTILMVLNMFPLPPLDGGRVLVSLLPGPLSWRVSRIEPYGFPILLLLMFTGLLSKILWPAISLMLDLLSGLSGLSAELYFGLLSVLMK